MKNISPARRKILTVLVILALLVMILPVAVMARENLFTPKLPDQASTQASIALASRQLGVETESTEPEVTEPTEPEETESTEPEETESTESASENKSERAVAVEARNQQAADWGLPPGHVNLFDKLAALTGETRESIYERFISETEPMTVQDLMKEIKEARKTEMTVGSATAASARNKEHKNPQDD
jgi:hypothetical protein